MKLYLTRFFLCALAALAVLLSLPSCVAPCAPYAPACGPRVSAPCGGYNYSYQRSSCYRPVVQHHRHCY